MQATEDISHFFPDQANGRFMWITHNYVKAQNNQRANDEQLLKKKNE